MKPRPTPAADLDVRDALIIERRTEYLAGPYRLTRRTERPSRLFCEGALTVARNMQMSAVKRN